MAEGVNEVNSMVENISTNSNEQFLGLSQVESAISTIEQVTSKNAAIAEESASNAASLQNQATKLSAAVDELTKLLKGRKAASVDRSSGVSTSGRKEQNDQLMIEKM